MLKRKTVAVVENISDCRAVERWLKIKQNSIEIIIALSLDSFEYLQVQGLPARHVWEFIEMEDLITDSVHSSIRISEEWILLSKSIANPYFYESAAQHRIELEFLEHVVVCAKMVNVLEDKFRDNQWICLLPKIKLDFLGPFFPRNQKRNKHNFLFKASLYSYFSDHGVEVIHTDRLNRFLFRIIPLVTIIYIFRQIGVDILEFVVGKLVGKKTFDQLKKNAFRKGDILFTGWGRDLSRMLSLNNLKKIIDESNSGISFINLVWRPKKMRDIPKNSDNFFSIFLREKIKNGVSYGPEISLFSVSIWKKYVAFIIRVIVPCYRQIFSLPVSSIFATEALSFSAVRWNFFYNTFFAYREAFLTREIITNTINYFSPKAVVGSDSGGVSARAELLIAKELGVRTWSTPHGYQTYALPPYNYIADYIFTHAPGTQKILTDIGLSPERIIPIGTTHDKRGVPPMLHKEKIRVVIGTRSWTGLWSNFASKHNLYYSEMGLFIQKIINISQISLTVKSHPNGDYDEYYDLLINKLKSDRVCHISSGWKNDDFVNNCDILVCFGESPSLLFSALFLKIPVIFITGTMTQIQEELQYTYQGVASVVKTASEAVDEIEKIINNPEYYTQVMEKQNKFADQYIMDNPERNLLRVLTANLD